MASQTGPPWRPAPLVYNGIPQMARKGAANHQSPAVGQPQRSISGRYRGVTRGATPGSVCGW